jgi:NAD(P)-dependent dehydrogenase (short-subunit alcohol dehydrogenase family)
VFGRECRDAWLGRQQFGVEVVAVEASCNRHIRAPVANHVGLFTESAHHDSELRRVRLRTEPFADPVQQLRGHPWFCGDHEAPAGKARTLRPAYSGIESAQDHGRFLDQGLAGLGQRQPVLGAVEQGDTEPALQLTYGPGQRRLSDAEALGRACDVQVLSDSAEVAQFADFRLRHTVRVWGGTHSVFFFWSSGGWSGGMNANDIALVTGGNKGIGRQIVRRLAQQGYIVYLGARSPERGHSAVEELTKESATVRGGTPTEKSAGVDADLGRSVGRLDIRFVQLDVTDPESVEAAVNKIETEAGGLDVLVNNAGIMAEWGVRTADITAAQLRETYEVNVFGVVTVTSACVPLLRCSQNARIVNVSSGLGSLTLLSDPESPISTRGFLAYSSSKAALNALTLIYANALRTDGIKVNAVSPGPVPTDQNAAATFPRGDRTPADGALVPTLLAMIPADGPTGAFRGPDTLDDIIPW